MVNFVQSPPITNSVACPCCSSTRLEKYQDRNDNTGRPLVMLICRDCTAIVNATDLIRQLSSASVIDKQLEGSTSFYKADEKMLAEAVMRVGWHVDILEFALNHLPKDFHKGVYADFGAGLGFMSAAAAFQFEQVYAVEINTIGIRDMMRVFPKTDNMHICKEWSQISQRLDFVCLWHVVEHFPDARAMMGMMVEKVNPGGAIYMQVPMLRYDHVFDTHYAFYAEPSFRTLCKNAGLIDTQVWYDTTNEFVTCLSRKPA